jgi:hypothetical protein
MITAGVEWVVDPLEDRLLVVTNDDRLAVYRFGSPHDPPSEMLSYRLVTEADSKDRELSGKTIDHVQGYSRIIRSSGAGRDQDVLGFKVGLDLVDRNLVVSNHAHHGAQLTEILHEVVRERVVVVYNKNHLLKFAINLSYLVTVTGGLDPMYRIPLILAILTISATLCGAQAIPEKLTEPEEKLRKEAVAFLRETLTEVNTMRTLENRVSFTSDLAGLMWYYDEREARAMYIGVIADFRDLLTKYDAQMNSFGLDESGDPEPMVPRFGMDQTDKMQLLRKYSTAMGVRQQIATSMAEHDPDLAFGFYYDSLAAISNPELLKQHDTRDSHFESQLLTELADRDAAKAAKYAARSVSIGLSYQHVDLLRKIHGKDPEKGSEFGAAILAKAKVEKPDKVYLSVLASVIHYGEETLEQSRKRGGKRPVYTQSQLRELVEVLAQGMLSRGDAELYSISSYLGTVQRHLPGRAAQIRTKFRSADVSGELTYATNAGRAAANAALYAANAVATAANAVSNSDIEMVRKLEDREKAEKKFAEDMESLSNKQLPKEERERIITQARKIIMQTQARDKKVLTLSLLASQVAKAGDKELAAEIMRDAEKLVNPAPKNYQEFTLTWLLATGYASSDPDKAFPLLEDTIGRANDTLSAFVKVGEFMDVAEEMIQDGEVQVGAFGGRMVSGLTRELGMADATIQVLARADFTKTKNLTNRFDRPEIRVLAKLMVLRALLKPNEAGKVKLVETEIEPETEAGVPPEIDGNR